MVTLLVTLLACAPDLPEGWETAERVTDFAQTPCDKANTSTFYGAVTSDGDSVTIEAQPVSARCDQALEAWWQATGSGGGEVLVQPVDMNPASVGKCACGPVAVSFRVPTTTLSTFDVYKRDDRHGTDDPQPYLLGEVGVLDLVD